MEILFVLHNHITFYNNNNILYIIMYSISPNYRLVAGRDSRVSFNLTYQNNGEEEARGLMLLFTGLLSQYFTSITLSPIVRTLFINPPFHHCKDNVY